MWLGLAVGLGRGEGSSGGDGVFAMRRGPESLDEHRELSTRSLLRSRTSVTQDALSQRNPEA